RFAQCFKEISSQSNHGNISIYSKPERFCSKETTTRVLPFHIAINQSSKGRFTNTGHACKYNSRSIGPGQYLVYVLNHLLTLYDSPGVSRRYYSYNTTISSFRGRKRRLSG